MNKAKIIYFTAFLCVVIAFIFHVTAMGHNHWKVANKKNELEGFHEIKTIGLFTRCSFTNATKGESCVPNMYPKNTSCLYSFHCVQSNPPADCSCDYTPSTKGIAACTIIASIFLGSALIILFVHSIGSTNSRVIELLLGYLPLLQLLLAFIFILIALILVGSYLSRDFMHMVRTPGNTYTRPKVFIYE